MDLVDLENGVAKALDALYADRLVLLCGAGLSMADPSALPSAATLATKAKRKYDATYGAGRDPLPELIDDQAEFFSSEVNLPMFICAHISTTIHLPPSQMVAISLSPIYF